MFGFSDVPLINPGNIQGLLLTFDIETIAEATTTLQLKDVLILSL
jgi:hypothetical protein